MSVTHDITTAAALFAAGDLGPCELIRGELHMMSPAGGRHGRIAHRLAFELGRVVHQHRLGVLLTAETGFLLERDPDTVRAPDIAFISRDRANQADVPGYVPIPPDLAVEVNSPHDRASDVSAKVRDWLKFGVRIVWVVDPPTQSVTVYAVDGLARILDRLAELTADDVIPAFRLQVYRLFD